MNPDTKTLDSIPSGKPIRVFLPLVGSPEMARAQCIYDKTEPPKFSLIFKPGALPEEDIDIKKPCILSIDMGGPTLSIEAMIKSVSSPQVLEMIVRKTVSHEQMREFFRVDTVTNVITKSFRTEFVRSGKESWALDGKTVDISGSGLLAIFNQSPPTEKHVHLEISIPSEPAETITVLAHQVRVQELQDGRFEVAYHFVDISDEDRDKIIGCCLIIQRQMLRLKVQVKDT